MIAVLKYASFDRTTYYYDLNSYLVLGGLEQQTE